MEISDYMRAANEAAKFAEWVQERTELEKFLMGAVAMSFGMFIAARSGALGHKPDEQAVTVAAIKGCYEAWDEFQHDGKDSFSTKRIITIITANIVAACAAEED